MKEKKNKIQTSFEVETILEIWCILTSTIYMYGSNISVDRERHLVKFDDLLQEMKFSNKFVFKVFVIALQILQFSNILIENNTDLIVMDYIYRILIKLTHQCRDLRMCIRHHFYHRDPGSQQAVQHNPEALSFHVRGLQVGFPLVDDDLVDDCTGSEVHGGVSAVFGTMTWAVVATIT
jgi:hypothetical protein